MSIETLYTRRECTVKNCTVGGALELAKRKFKGTPPPINVTEIRHRDLAEPITLQEKNELAETIYLDTVCYL